jgi:hypothetical protein
MAATFYAVVGEDGKRLHWDNPAAKDAYIAKFAADEIAVTIKRKPTRQGTRQLRYLRGVVIPAIAEACGYSDPDDYEAVYDGLMWKFYRLPDGPFGEPRRRSCAKDQMSKEELTGVIDTLITYAETSIPGCRVPRPEEVDMDDVSEHGEWA